MLVNRYLLGEKIENIETYENNPMFMMEAIKRCHNKDLFFSCGRDVILDKYFIKFIIETFPEDYDFLEKTIDYFIESKELLVENDPENNAKYLEDILTVLLSMSKLEAKKHGRIGFNYTINLFAYQYEVINEIEYYYKKYGKRFEGGMSLIKRTFQGNNELINHFAWLLFMRILKIRDINLQYLIGKHFVSYEDVCKRLRVFFYEYVKSYDYDLALHIVIDKDFYNELLEDILETKINFNTECRKKKTSKIIRLSDYKK